MSHPYPELAALEEKIEQAQTAYWGALRHLFPLITHVRVNHYRGSFTARVVGHDAKNRRLLVQNDKTGKMSYVYPRLRVGIDDDSTPRVEILEG